MNSNTLLTPSPYIFHTYGRGMPTLSSNILRPYRRGMPTLSSNILCPYRQGMPRLYRQGMPRLFSQRPNLISGAHMDQVKIDIGF